MTKRKPLNTDSFGDRMARLRKDASYTQQQLADKVGVSRRMIAYYEGETGHPPASFLVNLAHALAVTADELLGIEPKKKTAAKKKAAPKKKAAAKKKAPAKKSA